MEIATHKRTMLHAVVLVLVLAAAYGIAGHLGRLLVIPPGYATGFWPASGLALTAVLIGGTRVWPGIWLGSLIANMGSPFDATNAATLLTSAVIPITFGFGATMQAVVGACLIRRYVGFPNTLTRAREIGTLLILGGPVSCIIGATVGITALAIGAQSPWRLYALHWATWWIGDTFGVLITTPLVLSWLAEPRAVWRRMRLSVVLPLIGALTLAVILFTYMHAQEQERLRLLFEHQAEAPARAIQAHLDYYTEVLRSLSFHTDIPEMSGPALHAFVQQHVARHRGLQTLAWKLRVPAIQWEVPEESARREPSSSLQSPGQDGPDELVQPLEETFMIYVEPDVGGKPALGLDVASILGNREALHQARDTGLPVVPGRLTLDDEPGHPFGLLVVLPMYHPTRPYATVEERRKNLRGYVVGMVRVSDVVEASLQGQQQDGIVLRIEDEASPVDQRILYHSRSTAEGSDRLPDGRHRPELAGMHWKTTVELAGRHWSLHFVPTSEYLGAQQSFLPWAALGGGLAFTSLLGAFLLIVTGRAILIDQLIVERTTQLKASKLLEVTAKQRRREAEVLAELARTINADLDVNTVLQRVADGTREVCNSDWAAIALREPEAESAVMRYWSGVPNQECYGVRIEVGEGIGGSVLATGRPCRTDHTAPDPQLSGGDLSTILAGWVASLLVVPIHIGERVDGILYVGTRQPRTFTDHDEVILQRLADHAAIAHHNARMYATAEHRRHTAESLAKVGRLLSQSLDSLEVGQQVVDHVRKLLQAHVAALYQIDPTSGMLVVLAASDTCGPSAKPHCSLPHGTGVVGLAVHLRQPVVTADILADSRVTLPAPIRARIERTRVRAELALPLLRDGTVIGVLSIGDEFGRIFDKEDVNLARLFADQASSALANARLYAEVQAARGRLRGLSRQLLEAQEAERHRIAHELHDEAGQLLVSVYLALEAAVSDLPPQFREGFHAVRDHLDAIEDQLRRLSHELRPTILDDLGLLPALLFLAEGVAARTGLCIHVESAIEGRLAPHVETVLYRIMQEGITNITKHAAATRVKIQLWQDVRMVHGLLQDDGVGFPVEQTMNPEGSRGLGLLGIQERLGTLGGTLQISAASGQGTTLLIKVPVEPWETVSKANDAGVERSVLVETS